jgi:hypothetical protein
MEIFRKKIEIGEGPPPTKERIKKIKEEVANLPDLVEKKLRITADMSNLGKKILLWLLVIIGFIIAAVTYIGGFIWAYIILRRLSEYDMSIYPLSQAFKSWWIPIKYHYYRSRFKKHLRDISDADLHKTISEYF